MPLAKTSTGHVITCDGCRAPLEHINEETMVFDLPPEARALYDVPDEGRLVYIVCEALPGRTSCLDRARAKDTNPPPPGRTCDCDACLRAHPDGR
ncbi:hypothetical protein [Pseudonocardia sp. T1-2H]|uniref:hypothetical protein n=1 Tax=Pseudonocardia sp. T1-2H TaxID=3128899 RepID=UPI0031014C4F